MSMGVITSGLGGVPEAQRYFVTTDANDTLRQRIVDTILARMATITIANGFKTDAGNNVFDWEEFALDTDVLPALTFRDEPNDPEQATVGIVDNSMTCTITAYGPRGTTSKAQGRLMIADVLQMIGTDDTYGGLAFDTLMPSEEPEFEQLEKDQYAASIIFVIQYNTDRFSAYART